MPTLTDRGGRWTKWLVLIVAGAGLAGLFPAVAFGQITFLNAWGSSGSGNDQFYFPDGVAVGPTGTVYVADTDNNRIETFSSNGAFQGTFGSSGSGTDQFSYPYGVAVGPAGTVYVADTGNYRIETFSSNGAFQGTFGSSGSGNDQFNLP